MKRNLRKKLNATVPKYRAKPTVIGGQRFDSKKEARRFLELRALERAGKIKNLRCQVPFNLYVNNVLICRYVCDFMYVENGIEIVEDAKGFLTREYKLKKKLMLACYGIEITET